MGFRFAAALLGLASMFGASSPLWAKGRMLRIEISGRTLTSPIQITDELSLEVFTFWDGPGNNGMRLENAESGPIIDWKTGIVAQHPAADLQRYEVSFYWMGCARDDPAPRDGKHSCAEVPVLAYVVFYEFDASSKQGFVYLPGEGDGELEGIDSGTIYRGPGVAGHWFRATNSWTDFVGPLIAKAPHRSH